MNERGRSYNDRGSGADHCSRVTQQGARLHILLYYMHAIGRGSGNGWHPPVADRTYICAGASMHSLTFFSRTSGTAHTLSPASRLCFINHSRAGEPPGDPKGLARQAFVVQTVFQSATRRLFTVGVELRRSASVANRDSCLYRTDLQPVEWVFHSRSGASPTGLSRASDSRLCRTLFQPMYGDIPRPGWSFADRSRSPLAILANETRSATGEKPPRSHMNTDLGTLLIVYTPVSASSECSSKCFRREFRSFGQK